ncbi:MAG: DUF2809 domain-containing protein [Lacisediminihabitans sp.]
MTSAAARPRRRLPVLALAALVIAAGLGVHYLLGGELAAFLADALYAVLIALLVMLVAPRTRPALVAGIAFAVCALVELAQLSGIPAALARAFPPSALVLGSGFAWSDLVAYALGVLAVLAADILYRRRTPR